MADIDEVKEILNSLRVAMSLVVGLLVVITGATIKLEQEGQTGIYFYAGLISIVVLIIVFLKIVSMLRKNIRKIKEL